MRRLLIVLALALATIGGVAAASIIVPQPGDETTGGPDAVQPDGTPATIDALAADPSGGPRWGVRVYRSRAGLTCPEPGRVQEGAFGPVDAEGKVRARPVQASGACVDLSAADPIGFAIATFRARAGQGARAVLFGVAPGVQDLRYVTPSGDRRLPRAPDGAFMVVEAGFGLAGTALVVVPADSGERRYSLPSSAAPAHRASR